MHERVHRCATTPASHTDDKEWTFDFMFQLNAPFLYYINHIPLHVSSNTMFIIRRIHCIHTASGSLYVTLLRWPLSALAGRVLCLPV